MNKHTPAHAGEAWSLLLLLPCFQRSSHIHAWDLRPNQQRCLSIDPLIFSYAPVINRKWFPDDPGNRAPPHIDHMLFWFGITLHPLHPARADPVVMPENHYDTDAHHSPPVLSLSPGKVGKNPGAYWGDSGGVKPQ